MAKPLSELRDRMPKHRRNMVSDCAEKLVEAINAEEKIMLIAVAPREKFQARTIAIARGEHKVTEDEPKVWFESLSDLGQLLCAKNCDLLRIIHQNKPESLQELVGATGRCKSGLSRVLKTMELYGIVTLTKCGKNLKVTVNATSFRILIDLR